jgi:small subunit ribosomal protein S2
MSAVSPHEGFGVNNYNSMTSRDTVTIRQLLSCGMHLGHAPSRWHPKMAPFIFGERAGIHIINLERTLICLKQACQVVLDIVAKGGSVLFVGTGDSIQRLTYEVAQDCGQFYVNLRWIGGTITNRSQVLRDDKLIPDIIVILDPMNNKKAILEASAGGIPVIAICDTNMDPTNITYPIPANDDAFASIELIARTLSLAAAEGKAFRFKSSADNSSISESASLFIDKVFKRRDDFQ